MVCADATGAQTLTAFDETAKVVLGNVSATELAEFATVGFASFFLWSLYMKRG
jgi:hypothetical protein